MGAKLPAGVHSRQRTVPYGEPRVETATDSGTTHDGVWFAWNAATGRYQARIPPNSTPPGEWSYLDFDASGYTGYQTNDEGTVYQSERGTNVWNGPLI
jgi:hypothetical protein